MTTPPLIFFLIQRGGKEQGAAGYPVATRNRRNRSGRAWNGCNHHRGQKRAKFLLTRGNERVRDVPKGTAPTEEQHLQRFEALSDG